jgi:hypothetical protein
LNYDAAGNLVGIDIDNASRKVVLKELTLGGLPTDFLSGKADGSIPNSLFRLAIRWKQEWYLRSCLS